jgi:hypothetical protein
VLLREVKLALFREARAAVALTQDLEGRPTLGELLRDTALGMDDGLREMLGLLVLRGGRRGGGGERALFGTIHNAGSRASPAYGLLLV